jgi:hypothetical protein
MKLEITILWDVTCISIGADISEETTASIFRAAACNF